MDEYETHMAQGVPATAVEARVSTLERQFSAISGKLDNLSEKMDARRAVPWGAIGTGVASLAFLGSIVIWAFSAYISQMQIAQQSADRRIEQLAAVVVPRAELEDRRTMEDMHDAQIRAELLRISEAIVPRGEHQERWRSIDAQIQNNREMIEQVREDFGSSYSLKDALADLQERLERLENRGVN